MEEQREGAEGDGMTGRAGPQKPGGARVEGKVSHRTEVADRQPGVKSRGWSVGSIEQACYSHVKRPDTGFSYFSSSDTHTFTLNSAHFYTCEVSLFFHLKIKQL